MSFHIAIIEDDEVLQDLYLEAFESVSEEIDCLTFQDAETAIAFLQENRVDLIIADIKLPNMSGLDLVRELRRKSSNSNSLIFIVSGYITDEAKELEEGTNDIKVFSKPVDNINNFVSECLRDLNSRRALTYDPMLLELIRDSAYSLLGNYFEKTPIVGRCQLKPLNTSPKSLRGYIPFIGKGFAGSLSIDLGLGFVNMFNENFESDEELPPAEIAYELTNQLAGQFKTEIAEAGYKITIGIPMITDLKEVQERRKGAANPVVYIPAGYMGSLFRIEFSMTLADLEGVEQTASADEVASGDMVLFF